VGSCGWARVTDVVTPASGGPRATFAISFPAQSIGLDLQLVAPRGCGDIDDLHIAIARAQTGRFRFGPRAPGARPRRDGKRLSRWCRGRYRGSVVAREEFEPTSATEIAVGHFAVR
jgi:hypothetical protein